MVKQAVTPMPLPRALSLAASALFAALVLYRALLYAAPIAARNALHVELMKQLGSAAGVEEAVREELISSGAYRSAGAAAFHAGRYEEAQALLARAVEQEPDDSIARYLSGWSAYTLGAREEAIALWNSAHPEEIATGFARRADQAFFAGDPAQTVEYSELALALNPRLSTAHYQIGRAYALQGQWEQAISSYERGLEFGGRSSLRSSIYRALGRAHVALDDQEAAAGAFEQAVALEPYVYLARLDLGDQYIRLGRYEDAVAQLETALSINAQDARAYIMIGDALVQQGNAELAESWYRRAIEAAPSTGRAEYALGEFLLAEGRVEEAIVYLEQAIQGGWTYYWVWIDLGTAYRTVGRLEDAVRAYSSLAEAEGRSERAARSWVTVAQLYTEMGNQPAASETWQKVLEIDPQNPQALEATGE